MNMIFDTITHGEIGAACCMDQSFPKSNAKKIVDTIVVFVGAGLPGDGDRRDSFIASSNRNGRGELLRPQAGDGKPKMNEDSELPQVVIVDLSQNTEQYIKTPEDLKENVPQNAQQDAAQRDDAQRDDVIRPADDIWGIITPKELLETAEQKRRAWEEKFLHGDSMSMYLDDSRRGENFKETFALANNLENTKAKKGGRRAA